MNKKSNRPSIGEMIVNRAEQEVLIPWIARTKLVKNINEEMIMMFIFGTAIGILVTAAVAVVVLVMSK